MLRGVQGLLPNLNSVKSTYLPQHTSHPDPRCEVKTRPRASQIPVRACADLDGALPVRDAVGDQEVRAWELHLRQNVEGDQSMW